MASHTTPPHTQTHQNLDATVADLDPNQLPQEVAQDDDAFTGKQNSRMIESDQQGITNHSASEEAARQKKVVSQRPDAQAGVDQVGHKVA